MDKFTDLPDSVKAALGVGAVVAVFAAGLFAHSGFWILLTILVLFAILLGGYFLWRMWKRRRESARFSEEVRQQSSATPRGISDPGKRAQLDDLRRKFEEGLNEYRSRGRDLYTLPWCLVVGESGSGKTEAIRHCNVGFPPGMQDEMQGAGGTVNMNWWFTNSAVLLDTAGKMLFEEVRAGETNEWREFLKLLRKSRPNCPINGLLLVIPSDSLVKDSAELIGKKAGRIAQQLGVIQRALDIRFPVFVVVTKCDLLPGFREFFDPIADPVLQHQMLGWSNPEPLDAPFRPELVDQHLETVAERLRRRRMGLLRDPVPETAPNRRIHEVDALYVLPNGITMIAPRLRQYLETIFTAGVWSSKPLFLRGIYFTSSLREGTALDIEVAQALGVSVAELPQGRVWERDRSFFLRDVFIEKVFPEKGLVTHATNTSQAIRRRQIALLTCGFAALIIFLTLAWLGMRAFQKSVGAQSTYWKTAAQGLQDLKTWKPIVSPASAGSSVYRYNGDDVVRPVNEATVKFQSSVRDLAAQPLQISWIFRPIARLVLKKQLDPKRAQRIVLETGVIKPLVAAARQKMKQSGSEGAPPAGAISAAPDQTALQAAALVALIQLEADIWNRQEGRKRGVIEKPEAAQKFLSPLLLYVTGKEPDKKLTETMAWTYSADGGGRGTWPPSWLSAGSTLAENEPIQNGLDQFISNASQASQGFDVVRKLRDALREYQNRENELAQAPLVAEEKNLKLLAALQAQKERLDGQLSEAAKTGTIPANCFSMLEAYNFYINHTRSSIEQVFKSIEIEIDKVGRVESAGDGKPKNEYTLFREIRDQLGKGRTRIEERLKESFPTAELNELRALDEPLMTNNGGGRHLYEIRPELYQKTYHLLQTQVGFPLVASTSAKVLDLDQLQQAKLSWASFEKDLTPANWEALPSFHRRALTRLKERIAPFATVTRALLDEKDAPGSCTIALDETQSSSTVFKYRGIQAPPRGIEDTTTAKVLELWKDDMDKGVTLKAYRYKSESPVSTRTFPQWGAIQLLLKYRDHVKRSEDGRTWTLSYPVEDGPTSGFLQLKLTFVRPLPELSNWPTE